MRIVETVGYDQQPPGGANNLTKPGHQDWLFIWSFFLVECRSVFILTNNQRPPPPAHLPAPFFHKLSCFFHPFQKNIPWLLFPFFTVLYFFDQLQNNFLEHVSSLQFLMRSSILVTQQRLFIMILNHCHLELELALFWYWWYQGFIGTTKK